MDKETLEIIEALQGLIERCTIQGKRIDMLVRRCERLEGRRPSNLHQTIVDILWENDDDTDDVEALAKALTKLEGSRQ